MPGYNAKSLEALAHDPGAKVAYWRVVKANGGLMNRFPGGAEGQAESLRKEGFTLDRKGKTPKVTNFRESLVPL
jgi:alkylated DNA nucleotide flippase Atl1